MTATLRAPTLADARGIHQLVVDSGVLDVNSPYAYVLWADLFASTSVVAEQGDAIVGFCNGLIEPARPDTWFCWQIGVAEAGRGQGLASRMLRHALDATGATWLHTTITPSNEASRALFRSVARKAGADVSIVDAYPGALLGDGHEDEEHFRIGPFRRTP